MNCKLLVQSRYIGPYDRKSYAQLVAPLRRPLIVLIRHFTNYLGRGDYVFIVVCLFVCHRPTIARQRLRCTQRAVLLAHDIARSVKTWLGGGLHCPSVCNSLCVSCRPIAAAAAAASRKRQQCRWMTIAC